MKIILKAVADGVAFLLVLLAAIIYRICRVALGPDKAFPRWSRAFALLPGLTGI